MPESKSPSLIMSSCSKACFSEWLSRLSPTNFPETPTRKCPKTDRSMFTRKPTISPTSALRKKLKNDSINKYASNMVDQSMNEEYYDLPGTLSLLKVRNTFKEYFTYDPRG